MPLPVPDHDVDALIYALIPDGVRNPVALFEDLEDAIAWGIQRYGCDRFRIRYQRITAAGPGEDHDCPGAV